jgi:hypothetical protein
MLSAPIPLPNSDTAPMCRRRVSHQDLGRDGNTLSNTVGLGSPAAATVRELRKHVFHGHW